MGCDWDTEEKAEGEGRDGPQGQSRCGLLNCGLDDNHLLCKYIFYVRGLQGEVHAQGRLEPEEFHVQVIAKAKNMKLSCFEKSCYPSFTISPFSVGSR